MVFSSPRFFVFLAILLLVLSPRFRLRTKLDLLLVASCVFYAAWDYRYLALLLFVSSANYVCGNGIHASEDPRVRRRWLVASVCASLGTLAYFKYTNFLLGNLNAAISSFGLSVPLASILLPAGVSFYTFKTMSYTIDIYRRELAPSRSLMSYSTYVTFFPELIAGPIVRASIFLPQMGRVIGPNAERLQIGASIFLVGLTKKLFIADRLAGIADPIFASPQTFAPATLWMGTLAYALQIYCDFSGYSDMAIGTAKMIGYDLPRNFRMPYLASDVSEFWRRWHITLSSWLRDYLYIPLGGNRRGRARTYLNLMLTMLLGGLWHGASWNFVLWGGLHGVALAVHRGLKSAVHDRPLLPGAVAIPITFLFVLLCWVPFRSPNWPTTEVMLRKMLSPGAPGVLFVPAALFGCLALVALGHAIGALLDRAVAQPEPPAWLARWLARFSAELLQDDISGWYLRFGGRTVAGSFLLAGWLLMLYFFSPTGTSPFIYFRF